MSKGRGDPNWQKSQPKRKNPGTCVHFSKALEPIKDVVGSHLAVSDEAGKTYRKPRARG